MEFPLQCNIHSERMHLKNMMMESSNQILDCKNAFHENKKFSHIKVHKPH